MNVINTFHADKVDERRLKKISIARDIAIVQRGDQRRVIKVGQSSKLKHISFEEVEHELENYDRIREEEIKLLCKRRNQITHKKEKSPKMSLFYLMMKSLFIKNLYVNQ